MTISFALNLSQLVTRFKLQMLCTQLKRVLSIDNYIFSPKFQLTVYETIKIIGFFLLYAALLCSCGNQLTKPAHSPLHPLLKKDSFEAEVSSGKLSVNQLPSYVVQSPLNYVSRIVLLEDDLFWVESASGEYFNQYPPTLSDIPVSPMIAQNLTFTGPKHLQTSNETEILKITTQALLLEINKTSLCISVFSVKISDQKTLLNTICPQKLEQNWKELSFYAPQNRWVYGLGQHFFNPESADGDLSYRSLIPGPFGNELRGFSGGANSVSQFPTYTALSEKGQPHTFILDNVYRQEWRFIKDHWRVNTFGDSLRYFFLAKETLSENRQTLLTLAGKPAVLPRKMFGLWLSEFGYDNWQEIETKRLALAKANMPLDGFVLDLQWFGGEFFGSEPRMGSLRFYEPWFPKPKENISKLKQLGLGIITVEESYIEHRLPEHQDMATRGYLVRKCPICGPSFLSANPWWGMGGMIDWSNQKAADYWHDTKREPLIDLGVLGHWTDLGEPEMFDPQGWYYGLPNTNKHAQADYHNLYAMLWSQGIARGYQRNLRQQRPFILSRAGTIGIQRFGTAMWSGDIGANLGALKAQANAQMQMFYSGLDYYGSDAGGFHRYSLDGDLNSLYTQWLAQSALYDFPVRPHTWNTNNSNETSPAAIGHIASNRENLLLRYNLFPYYYSLAHRAFEFAQPIIAPVNYFYPHDPLADYIGHQKMIGDSLLSGMVADYNGTQRAFYFPKESWFNFRTGMPLNLPNETLSGWHNNVPTISTDGNFELPLFAKAGAIIPWSSLASLDTPQNPFDIIANNGLGVRIFPKTHQEDSSFFLMEDDGWSIGYKATNAIAKTQISAQSTNGRVSKVTLHATQGGFAGMQNSIYAILEIAKTSPLDKLKSINVTSSINTVTLPACAQNFEHIANATKIFAPSGKPESTLLPDTLPCFLGANKETNFVTLFFPNHQRTTPIKIEINWEYAPNLDSTYPPQPDHTTSSIISDEILFVCRNAQTRVSEAVYVLGDHPLLGGWDINHALKLEPALYPNWAKKLKGFLPGQRVLWKCLIRNEGSGELKSWQDGSQNNVTVLQKNIFPTLADSFFTL